MTDRELLKAAARAAELDCIFSGGQIWTTLDGSINKHTERWNPLSNDGQALRLAVKLRLLESSWLGDMGVTDPYAAARRAIVRAAAEIGKSMK